MTTREILRPSFLGGLQIQKAAERPPFLNLLVYGDAGWGKTLLCGSADAVPEMRKVIVIDVEGGAFTLRSKYPEVDIIRVQNWVDMVNVLAELRGGGHGYTTAVLDSLTEIQKLNMYSIMQELLRRTPDRDEDVPSMREWGINLEQMRKLVRAFRDLEMNVLFTALAREDKNPRTGLVKRQPSLSGKLAGEVAAFLDIVVYGYMKEFDGEQKRLLLTGATDEVVAKDRSDKLPIVIEEPDMKTLYDILFGTPNIPEAKE